MSEIGHNVAPDYAATVTDRLEQDYAEAVRNAEAMIAEARALPAIEPDDDRTLGLHSSMIERMRDSTSRFEKYRVVEKEPHMRAAEATDGFFFGWIEKLARRKKTDKPGVADILQARVNAEMNRRLDEQRRLRAEAEAKARAAEEALRMAQAEAARKAAEAQAAADRARKQENIDAHEKRSLLEAAEAERLNAERMFAAQVTEDARIDRLAKAADMVRTRPDGSPMVTMRQVPVVVIEDETALDMAALWPHIKEEAKLQALKSWAKVTGHKKQMTGATIKMVDEAVVR
jgi:hypothetical protein